LQKLVRYLISKITETLKSGSMVIQGHRKWYYMIAYIPRMFPNFYGNSVFIHRVSIKKTSKIIFAITTSNFHQIWYFFSHKGGKQSKIICGALIFHFT